MVSVCTVESRLKSQSAAILRRICCEIKLEHLLSSFMYNIVMKFKCKYAACVMML